jgi:hypothetical protein
MYPSPLSLYPPRLPASFPVFVLPVCPELPSLDSSLFSSFAAHRTGTRGGHFRCILPVRILRAQTASALQGGATARFPRRLRAPRCSHTLSTHPSFIPDDCPPSSACLLLHSFCVPVTSQEGASSAHPWRPIGSAVCRSAGAAVPPLTCCGGVLSCLVVASSRYRRHVAATTDADCLASCRMRCVSSGCIWLNVLPAPRVSVSVSLHPCDGGAPTLHLRPCLEGAFSRGSICAASSASSPPPLLACARPPLVALRHRCRPAGACCDAACSRFLFSQ